MDLSSALSSSINSLSILLSDFQRLKIKVGKVTTTTTNNRFIEELACAYRITLMEFHNWRLWWLSSHSSLADYCQRVIFNWLLFLYFGNVQFRIFCWPFQGRLFVNKTVQCYEFPLNYVTKLKLFSLPKVIFIPSEIQLFEW